MLILSQLSVVRAKPMEMPCSWPFHIRSCIANELRLTHQIRRRMLLPPHTLLVLCSQYSHVLVCSPDTDVYHIGFPLLSPENNVIVQLNTYTSIEHQYLQANKLRLALNCDPDLVAVEADSRLALLQALFVATGCDYTSFFAGIGKATFMRVAFQHCSFVLNHVQVL